MRFTSLNNLMELIGEPDRAQSWPHFIYYFWLVVRTEKLQSVIERNILSLLNASTTWAINTLADFCLIIGMYYESDHSNCCFTREMQRLVGRTMSLL